MRWTSISRLEWSSGQTSEMRGFTSMLMNSIVSSDVVYWILVDDVCQLMRKTNIFNILSFSKICLWFPSYLEFLSCKKTHIDIVRWWDTEDLPNFTVNRKYEKDKINIFCIEFDISDWEEEIEDDWSHSAICHPTLYQQTSASANNIYIYSLV